MNQKLAMKPGCSRLLMNQNVITSTNSNPQIAATDLTMMSMVASLECTEKMWHELVESVGLKVVKIWTSPTALESLIEGELAE